MKPVIVIGAGIGGLTAAASLAHMGVPVHVLEAHIYPGGCAGTFYHQGYHFDAGATLAGGFYPGGPMDLVAQAAGIAQWPAHLSETAMQVYMPDGSVITRYADNRRYAEYLAAFGKESSRFWRWQENTAAALWSLSMHNPDWPPSSASAALDLAGDGLAWLGESFPHHIHPGLLSDLFRPLSNHLKGMTEKLRLFIDAQLLISAQTTSRYTNALYGAAALDLPNRGVAHLKGGMGAIAETLVTALKANGGTISYRKEVTRIVIENGHPVAVETKHDGLIPASLVIANLPPWNIARLLGDQAPGRLGSLPTQPKTGWGAFTAYLGVDDIAIPVDFPLHHQIIRDEPLGEGNTVFMSVNPEWDYDRAPGGHRAITLSTHTDFNPWYHLHQSDPAAYVRRKNEYTERLLTAAQKVLPEIKEASVLVIPGTPLSFERFTRRVAGWVGGFPQTSLFKSWSPSLAPGLWMVGDSIFPGQSTAAVALGGLRVARHIQTELAHATNSRMTIDHSLKALSLRPPD